MSTTRFRLIKAATALFSELGYAGASIGRIEERAGLAPRAGGFYRHFESKEELLHAILKAEIDTPENTGAIDFLDLGDTREELIAIGRAYLSMNKKNSDLARLLEREVFRIPKMQAEVQAANEAAMRVISDWVARKPACADLEELAVFNLTVMIFGGWFFYLHKSIHQKITLKLADDEALLQGWASFWAELLDDEDGDAIKNEDLAGLSSP